MENKEGKVEETRTRGCDSGSQAQTARIAYDLLMSSVSLTAAVIELTGWPALCAWEHFSSNGAFNVRKYVGFGGAPGIRIFGISLGIIGKRQKYWRACGDNGVA